MIALRLILSKSPVLHFNFVFFFFNNVCDGIDIYVLTHLKNRKNVTSLEQLHKYLK